MSAKSITLKVPNYSPLITSTGRDLGMSCEKRFVVKLVVERDVSVSNRFCWHPPNNRKWFYIGGHDCARRHHSSFTDCHARKNRGSISNPDPISDDHITAFICK